MDAAGFLADGTSAFERSEWGRARELLSEAVRWLPEKSKEKQRAQRMIKTAERRLAPPRKPLPWKLIALAFVLLGAAAAGAYFYQGYTTAEALRAQEASASATAQAVATQQAETQALADATATAQALEFARQSAAATALALANQATATPLPTPTPAPTPTPTVDAVWLLAERTLDSVWGSNWPRAVEVLEQFRDQFPGYRPAQEKLYVALLGYAEFLFMQDQDDDGVKRLQQARDLFPDRGEAQAALLALTPTPVPVSPVRPAGPIIPARPPAAAPTKSPLAPR